MILCDTNIFIEYYRDNELISNQLSIIGQDNISMSIITAGELLYGARNKNEMKLITRDIENLKVIDINFGICKNFLKLMTEFSLSHKLSVPDALIAATVLEYKIEFYTLNIKDFIFIPDLKLYKIAI